MNGSDLQENNVQKEIDELFNKYYTENGKSPRVILLNEHSKNILSIQANLINDTVSRNYVVKELTEYKGIPVRVVRGKNEVF